MFGALTRCVPKPIAAVSVLPGEPDRFLGFILTGPEGILGLAPRNLRASAGKPAFPLAVFLLASYAAITFPGLPGVPVQSLNVGVIPALEAWITGRLSSPSKIGGLG
jgi:hypothetical protein